MNSYRVARMSHSLTAVNPMKTQEVRPELRNENAVTDRQDEMRNIRSTTAANTASVTQVPSPGVQPDLPGRPSALQGTSSGTPGPRLGTMKDVKSILEGVYSHRKALQRNSTLHWKPKRVQKQTIRQIDNSVLTESATQSSNNNNNNNNNALNKLEAAKYADSDDDGDNYNDEDCSQRSDSPHTLFERILESVDGTEAQSSFDEESAAERMIRASKNKNASVLDGLGYPERNSDAPTRSVKIRNFRKVPNQNGLLLPDKGNRNVLPGSVTESQVSSTSGIQPNDFSIKQLNIEQIRQNGSSKESLLSYPLTNATESSSLSSVACPHPLPSWPSPTPVSSEMSILSSESPLRGQRDEKEHSPEELFEEIVESIRGTGIEEYDEPDLMKWRTRSSLENYWKKPLRENDRLIADFSSIEADAETLTKPPSNQTIIPGLSSGISVKKMDCPAEEDASGNEVVILSRRCLDRIDNERPEGDAKKESDEEATMVCKQEQGTQPDSSLNPQETDPSSDAVQRSRESVVIQQQQPSLQVLSDEVTSQTVVLKIAWPCGTTRQKHSRDRTNHHRTPFRELQLHRTIRMAEPDTRPSSDITPSPDNTGVASTAPRPDVIVEYENREMSSRKEETTTDDSDVTSATADVIVQTDDSVRVLLVPVETSYQVPKLEEIVAAVGRTIQGETGAGVRVSASSNIRVTCEATQSKSGSAVRDQDVTVINDTIVLNAMNVNR